MYYFEYPSLAAMLVKDIRYGVDLALDAVRVQPFGVSGSSFGYHTGSINVDYDPAATSVISLPGAGLFPYLLYSMAPASTYSVTAASGCSATNVDGASWAPIQVTADAEGLLAFTAPRGVDCALTVKKM